MMTGFPEPRLDHLYDMRVDLEPPQVVGETPLGVRQVFIVKGGTFSGPRMRGAVLAGGGDWATIRPDGVLQLDVRATVQTDDGALVYAYYGGYIHPVSAAMRAAAGEDLPLGDYYFYTSPMFQTGSPQYQWLNRTMAIGRGKVIRSGVEYRVWAVVNP